MPLPVRSPGPGRGARHGERCCQNVIYSANPHDTRTVMWVGGDRPVAVMCSGMTMPACCWALRAWYSPTHHRPHSAKSLKKHARNSAAAPCPASLLTSRLLFLLLAVPAARVTVVNTFKSSVCVSCAPRTEKRGRGAATPDLRRHRHRHTSNRLRRRLRRPVPRRPRQGPHGTTLCLAESTGALTPPFMGPLRQCGRLSRRPGAVDLQPSTARAVPRPTKDFLSLTTSPPSPPPSSSPTRTPYSTTPPTP